MAANTIQIPPDSTGKFLDTGEVNNGANDVQRQRVQLTGETFAAIVAILNGDPLASDYALTVREAPPTNPWLVASMNAPSGAGSQLIGAPAAGFHIECLSIFATCESLSDQGWNCQVFEGNVVLFLPATLNSPVNIAPGQPFPLRTATAFDINPPAAGPVLNITAIYRVVPD